MLRIRLRRVGKKRQPYYRVVVADKPDRRDGDFIETLGSYDPHTDPPTITLDRERAEAWISKGAQPSEAVAKILRRQAASPSRTETPAATAGEPASPPQEAAEPDAAAAESPAAEETPDEPAADSPEGAEQP